MLQTFSYKTGFYSVGYNILESPVSEIEPADIEIDFPFKSSLHYFVRLVGSCCGLVCLLVMEYGGDKEFLCLWKPATREYKKIPEPPIETSGRRRNKLYPIRVLVYDHKTDNYKLAVGVTHPPRKDTVLQFYSLASNSWKPGPTMPYSFNYTARLHGELVNGYHHRILKAQGKFFLLSLDVCDEIFKEMQLPKQLLEKSREDDTIILGVLVGCLSILDSSYVNDVKINVEVWEMLELSVVLLQFISFCYVIVTSFVPAAMMEL